MSNAPRNHSRWQYATRDRTLFVLPEIDEDDDPARKDALALRNAATLAGRCSSCGATFALRSQRGGGIDGVAGYLVMEHEDDCPVLLDEVSS